MEPERLRQIEELYHAVAELDRDRQAAFLSEACGADESLRRELESLLAYGTKAADFIELPAMELEAGALARDDRRVEATPWMPARIGRYKVLRLLGEGGMGVVYEAEQEQPRRVVALKVIKPGTTGSEVLRRFDQESLALARLQHPGIAQIHDAGTADTGFGPQPYFAMELIHGRSLLEYAEAHRLTRRQRLELMTKICEAVEHAHQRGLIHRDLKPGNILVDETGQPKILDFGVARVTDSDSKATQQTNLGQLVGTLAYMSPEQVLADPLELDTRSDVYALGVILYELLAGRLPYNLSRQPHEAVRTIREDDPTPLSSVSRLYRGDIETIVAKALEKEKGRRYSSASALAADLQRYLMDEPIAARPASASYQLQKFARRHKALVAGVAAVFVVLLGGIIASTREAARATRERDRATAAEQSATRERDRALSAERAATMAEARARQEQNSALAATRRADTESATAKAVNDFLQNDLLAQASARVQSRPDTKSDPDLKVRTALDRSAARIEGRFAGQPLVEASIRHTIGSSYHDLGLFQDAERQLERAVELRRQALGEEHPDTLASMDELANVFQAQGNRSKAEVDYTKVVEARRRVLGEAHPDTLAGMSHLALLYHDQGKYPQAEPLFARVLQAQRRALGEQHTETLTTMANLALLYWSEGKYAQAEPLTQKVVELDRRVYGEEHPDTLTSMNNLALLYYSQGKYEQAEGLAAKVVEVKRRVLGEDHRDTLVSMSNLAGFYNAEGKYVQSALLRAKTLEIQQRVLGNEHPDTLTSMNNLATLDANLGKYAEAEQLSSRVLEVRRRTLGDEHPNTLNSLHNLGSIYQAEGKFLQSEECYIKALEARRRILGREHSNTVDTMYKLAQLYQDQGKPEQAWTLYANVLDIRRRVLGPQHPDTADVLVSLARVRLQEQRYADSEPLLREALAAYGKTPDSWRRHHCESILGASVAGQKRYAEAETLLLSGYQGMLLHDSTTPFASHLEMVQARQWVVELYEEWGKPGQAAAWRAKLGGSLEPSRLN